MGIVVAILLATCVALIVAVVALRRRVAELERALGDAVGGEPAEVIAIEIRNHGEVAANRTSLAKPLAVLTPGLLRGIVHRETVKMMRVELAENGVDADVRLRRIGPREPVDPIPSASDDD